VVKRAFIADIIVFGSVTYISVLYCTQ